MDKKGTILVVKGKSTYNVLRQAVDEIAEGFIKNGYDVETFDGTEIDHLSQMESLDISIRILTDTKYTMIFTMQSILSDVVIFNRNIIDYLKVPFFGYILDDPMFHADRLVPNTENFHLCCIDKNHMDFVNNYYKNIKNVHVLYHGGFNYKEDIIPLKDREIDVFISGSYISKEDLIKTIKKETNESTLFVYDVIEILQKNNFQVHHKL